MAKRDLTDHFDGTRFHNIEPTQLRSNWAMLKWRLAHIEMGKCPIEPLRFGPDPPTRVPGPRARYTVINHATVLIQVAGVNLLTDPFWSYRVGPIPILGPGRAVAPGLRIEQLPPIDALLISHNHLDHLDLPSLKALRQKRTPPILCGLGDGQTLRRAGLGPVVEMDWWDVHEMAGVAIRYVPAQHWSKRGLRDSNKSLWGGYVIESEFGRIYFAGDTAWGGFIELLRQRLGPMDLAFLPIGAYEPRVLMKDHHMNPEEAVRAHCHLEARHSVAIHQGTFRGLTDEGFLTPAVDLAKALAERGIPEKAFVVPEFGIGVTVDRSS